MVETCSASVLIGGNVWLGAGNIVDGINRFGVEHQLVEGDLAASAKSKSEISGFAVTPGEFKSTVQTTVPSLEECTMPRLFEGQLLGSIAQRNQTLLLDL